jgi:hypothetical protein
MAALAELRTRIERALSDATNQRFSEPDLDKALLLALQEYSRALPQRKVGTVTLAADGREVSLSSLDDLLDVEQIEWDYDADAPDYPPVYRPFYIIYDGTSKTLFVDTDDEPQSGDVVRVFYTVPQTIENLDGANETSVPAGDEGLLVLGAAGYAAVSRAASLLEKVGVDRDQAVRLEQWGRARLAAFHGELATLRARRSLAHGARVSGWDLDD